MTNTIVFDIYSEFGLQLTLTAVADWVLEECRLDSPLNIDYIRVQAELRNNYNYKHSFRELIKIRM